jgi:hypothetical protein
MEIRLNPTLIRYPPIMLPANKYKKYMQKIKYLFPLVLFFLLLNFKYVLADAYVLHLYYNTALKTLSFDKYASENISLDKTLSPSIIDFIQESELSSGQYTAVFYDHTNNEIISTPFNKKDGAFQLTIPHFSIATSLKIFEKASGKELLSADLAAFATCNGNGICEYEKKETAQNCLGDCANSNPQFSAPTLEKLNTNKGIIKDEATGEVQLSSPALMSAFQAENLTDAKAHEKEKSSPLILIIAILALVIIIGVFIYKKIKESRN